MRLSLPEHLDWLVLRRVRRGGVARFDGGYQDNGEPLGVFLVDILGWLDEQDLLEVADPDECGLQRLGLTEAGWDRYRELCRRQRRPKPPPEHNGVTVGMVNPVRANQATARGVDDPADLRQ